MSDLFIDRWTDDEILGLIKAYEDSEFDETFDWKEDLRTLLLSPGKRGARDWAGPDKIAPPAERRDYHKASAEYLKRKEYMPFEILKESAFNAKVCEQYFRWKDIFIHVLEIPLAEVPMYIQSEDIMVRFFSHQRLQVGK